MRRLPLALAAGLAVSCAAAQVPTTGAGAGAPVVGGPANMVTPVLALAGPTATFPTASGNNYYNIVNGGAVGASTNVVTHESIMPIAGTFSALNAVMNTDPGAGTWAVSLVKNGTTSTTLTCTVATGTAPVFGTGANCGAGTASVAVGDLVAWNIVGTSAPTVPTVPPQISALFTASSGNHSFINASSNNVSSASAINYLALGQVNGMAALEYNASVVFPTGGTLNSIAAVTLGGAPGAGSAYTFNVVKNGTWANTANVTTGIECQVANTNTACLPAANTGASITVAAGDTISIQVCPSTASGGPLAGCPNDSGATAGGWTAIPTARLVSVSFDWSPTTPGQAVAFVDMGTPPAVSANAFLNASGNVINQTSENFAWNVTPNGVTVTLGAYYVAQCPGPGATMTRTWQPRKASANIGSTVAFASNSTACPTMNTGNSSWSTTVSANGFFNYESLPTGGTNTALSSAKIGTVVTSP